MAQWGRNDQAVTSNSTVYSSNGAPMGTWALVKGGGGATAHNPNGTRADTDVNMFGNTTQDAFITGKAVGVFGEDVNEIRAERASGAARPAHAGWVIRTEGSGGRAGRVQYETLVAMGSLGAQTAAYGAAATTSDAEDVVLQDQFISVTTQPSAVTVNASSSSNTATFSVVAATVPAGGTITYLWQANSGSGYANAGSGTSGNTTATLTVNANVATNQTSYRVLMQATGATNVTSTAAKITITT
jgi:hypothetical protein